jgi:hypothetical protein
MLVSQFPQWAFGGRSKWFKLMEVSGDLSRNIIIIYNNITLFKNTKEKFGGKNITLQKNEVLFKIIHLGVF